VIKNAKPKSVNVFKAYILGKIYVPTVNKLIHLIWVCEIEIKMYFEEMKFNQTYWKVSENHGLESICVIQIFVREQLIVWKIFCH